VFVSCTTCGGAVSSTSLWMYLHAHLRISIKETVSPESQQLVTGLGGRGGGGGSGSRVERMRGGGGSEHAGGGGGRLHGGEFPLAVIL
jgi:hypothetical protein